MATIQKLFTLEVPPARFIESCTLAELHEVLLLASGRLQRLESGAVSEAATEPAVLPDGLAPRSGAGRRPGAPASKWTADNVALLRTMSAANAAKQLGVSPAAIHSARRRFGIAKPQKNPQKQAEAAPPAAGRGRGKEHRYDVNNNGALTGIML